MKYIIKIPNEVQILMLKIEYCLFTKPNNITKISKISNVLCTGNFNFTYIFPTSFI